MHIHIDPQSGLAIYEQIVRAVKFAVAHGGLIPGNRVPSVRELSVQIAVNPNTVARAYRDLQTEGVLTSVRGTGLEVSPAAPGICRKHRVGMLRERLRSLIDEAVQNGVPIDELRGLFEEVVANTKVPRTGRASPK
jgi:GntR family transcriptional regulator